MNHINVFEVETIGVEELIESLVVGPGRGVVGELFNGNVVEMLL